MRGIKGKQGIVPVRRIVRANELIIGGVQYPAAVAADSPGTPEELTGIVPGLEPAEQLHLFGDWWHVDLVRHLDGPSHSEPHTLACPMLWAVERHLVLHGFLADPMAGKAWGEGGHHPQFEAGHDHPIE
jgi:hypothetical protein